MPFLKLKETCISPEDDAKYKEMETRFDSLTNEIKRMERMEQSTELNKPQKYSNR